MVAEPLVLKTRRAKPRQIEANDQAPEAENIAADGGQNAGLKLPQRNKHDVKMAGEKVREVLLALAQRGITLNLDVLDVNNLRPRVQAYAACRLLVQKGLVTEEEMQVEESLCMRMVLEQILLAVDAQRGPQLAVPATGRGGLVVAKH